MRKLAPRDFDRLASLQSEAMNDLCNIYSVSMASGTYGNNVETRVFSSSGTSCGIQFTNGKTAVRGQVQFVDYDVILRIPADVAVGMDDEIDLIEKGDFLISGTFKPYAYPVVSSSVQHVLLKRQAP